MVRILHVLPHPGGGGETYVETLGRAPGTVQRRAYLSSGRAPRQAVLSAPASLARLALATRRSDVLHVHGDAAAVITGPLLALRPAVITTHGLHLLRRTDGHAHAAMALALRVVVSRSSAIICTSVGERDELAAVIGAVDLAKLRVIHNGVDTPPTIEPEERAAIRTALGCTQETVLGLFVGQLEDRKAPLVAAVAAERVRAAGVPFTLAVAGDGPLRPELERLPGDAVRLLGHRTDVPALLRAVDVFVQPSEREGMSLALLEAMACGLPVVAADGEGNVEALDGAGLLFSPGDDAALAAALTQLCREPELRDSLGQRASLRAAERFGVSRFLAETGAVYDAVIGGQGA
jgi:glycosyltransferase involved in cell wall biosynthesis